MALEFKESQIYNKEKEFRKPYIGFFSPKGELIDYNLFLCDDYHEDYRNPVSKTFLEFVSYIIEGTELSKKRHFSIVSDKKELIKNNEYNGIKDYVKRGYSEYYDCNLDDMEEFTSKIEKRIKEIESLKFGNNYLDNYMLFEYQLLLFFRNAYHNGKFFETINRKIFVEKPSIVKNRLKMQYPNSCEDDIESYYDIYLKKSLLVHFKDIAVQYLGYDSLERFKPNSEEIIIPKTKEYDFNFYMNPRCITTSYTNVNDRFYNYLLMNWRIYKVPMYVYNSDKLCYERINNTMKSEKEQTLEQEIRSIKKLVPIEDRYKFFR